jgi:hypothetical protein
VVKLFIYLFIYFYNFLVDKYKREAQMDDKIKNREAQICGNELYITHATSNNKFAMLF